MRPQQSTNDQHQKSLKELQEQSKQLLQEQGDVTQTKFVDQSKSIHTAHPQPAPSSAKGTEQRPNILSKEERRAQLAEQSKMLKKEVQVIKEQTTSEENIEPSAELETDEVVPEIIEQQIPSNDLENIVMESPVEEKIKIPSRKDVFKKIETKKTVTFDRRRSRRRYDQKGGGTQKKEKRLDSKRSLEYRYSARDILDDPGVAEIHRSNILGQVWAKGERINVEAAIDYIDEKSKEGMLPSEVSSKLKALVKELTTRR